MATVGNYNARNIIIIAAGIPISGGFAPGSKVKVTQTNDSYTVQEGVEGDITRSATNSSLFTVTFRLLQTSKFNAPLSAFHTADRASVNGSGIAPTTVKDKGGASLHFLSQSWITKFPEADYSGEDTFREWVITGLSEVNILGGN